MRSERVEYERMTPDELLAARNQAAVAFVPIGPLEWHGPHLPLGTDGLHAHHVAVRAARLVGGVVLPAFFVGTDSLRPRDMEPQGMAALGVESDAQVLGMDLPGFTVKSLYVHETVFGGLVREIIRLLKREPWELIVLINGHGAPNQQRMLRRIAEEETERPAPEVVYLTAWAPDAAVGGGHADRAEASVMMVLESSCVHVDRLPERNEPLVYREFGVVDGFAFDGKPNEGFAVPPDADPRLSSVEEGADLLVAEVRHITDVVTARLTALRNASAGKFSRSDSELDSR